MHITPEFAGLIAQVFPTLLIAIMLEGRLGRSGSLGRMPDLVLHYVRVSAILGATASTFSCLAVARSDQGDVLTDWLVNITWYLLIAAAAAMGGMFMRVEREDIRAYSRPRKRATAQKGDAGATERVEASNH